MSVPRSSTRFTRTLAAAVLVLPLVACAGTDGEERTGESRTGERVGTIAGAIGGAILGSRVGRGSASTLAAVAGAALGAYLGSTLGRMLDERDRELQGRAAEDAMTRPPGQSVSWSNPESGNSGAVTAREETKRPSDGAACRSFDQQVTTRDGGTRTTTGTACREPDGSWRVVSN